MDVRGLCGLGRESSHGKEDELPLELGFGWLSLASWTWPCTGVSLPTLQLEGDSQWVTGIGGTVPLLSQAQVLSGHKPSLGEI